MYDTIREFKINKTEHDAVLVPMTNGIMNYVRNGAQQDSYDINYEMRAAH